MTYDEFKDYCLTHLWKMGDQIVLDNLDRIIQTAEAELNRTFKVQDRETLATVTAVTNVISLPADCRSIRNLASPHYKNLCYAPPSALADALSVGTNPRLYSQADGLIILSWAPDAGKDEFTLWYYADIPKFSELDPGIGETSWLVEEYFDVYLYTVLKHSAPFLREDERVQVWAAYHSDAMATAMEENAHERQFSGSPGQIVFGGQ